MIAVDTNVVVRFLTRDDPAQAARAKACLESPSVLVTHTVLLETEWVLRNTYRFDRRAVAAGLATLLGMPGIEVADGEAVARALAWHGRGLDFADALHLATSQPAEAFVSFDRALHSRASRLADTPPVVAP